MKNILVVDDDPEILDIVPEFLADLNAHCLTFTSAIEALGVMEKEQIDVVISDIKMPDMDGLTFLQKVQEKGYSAPVILMTAVVDINLMYMAWKLGAFDFLDKPIHEGKLLEMVSKALDLQRPAAVPVTHLATGRKIPLQGEIDESLWARLNAYCRYHGIAVDSTLESIIENFLQERMTA